MFYKFCLELIEQIPFHLFFQDKMAENVLFGEVYLPQWLILYC